MNILYPKPWHLVLSGLLLNILAILLSSLIIERNEGHISLLNDEIMNQNHSIELASSQVSTLERKKELLLLYVSLGQQHNNEVSKQIQEQIALWTQSDIPNVTPANLSTLITTINNAQKVQRERIDDIYLNNISKMETVHDLDKTNAIYKNLSIFLQIFGLALILARDLRK